MTAGVHFPDLLLFLGTIKSPSLSSCATSAPLASNSSPSESTVVLTLASLTRNRVFRQQHPGWHCPTCTSERTASARSTRLVSDDIPRTTSDASISTLNLVLTATSYNLATGHCCMWNRKAGMAKQG